MSIHSETKEFIKEFITQLHDPFETLSFDERNSLYFAGIHCRSLWSRTAALLAASTCNKARNYSCRCIKDFPMNLNPNNPL